MYTSVDLFAFDLVLCTHDNCLVILLIQDHVFYLFKIHQLRGTIIKCNAPNFTDGLAFASRRIIRFVRVIFRACTDYFHDYFVFFFNSDCIWPKLSPVSISVGFFLPWLYENHSQYPYRWPFLAAYLRSHKDES